MSRYVDVEPLDVVGTKGVSKDYAEGMACVLDLLDNLPIADVEPVRHGHWMGCDGSVISCRCSVCGEKTFNLYEDLYDYPYCPNCGAKMDEKEQEHE